MATGEILCAGQHYVDGWKSCRADALPQNEVMQFAGIRACSECFSCMALTDELTGLPNRYSLNGLFEEYIDNDAPFGLLHIDLDRFKYVNDKFGHNTGDKMLINVARFLKSKTRGDLTGRPPEQRDFVFAPVRQGGDEFVVLARLTEADSDEPVENPQLAISIIANRLASEFLDHAPIASYNDQDEVILSENQLGMSVGTSIYVPGKTLAEMLEESEPIKSNGHSR